MPLADRIAQCAGCHGEDGNSRMENIPSLAGQPEFFVLNQLFLMREGVRKVEVMTPFVKDLKDDDLGGSVEAFRAASSPGRATSGSIRRSPAAEPSLPSRLRCASCHQPDLRRNAADAAARQATHRLSDPVAQGIP